VLINFEGEDNRPDYLVRRLNEFGKDGWRVASIDLTPHPAFVNLQHPVLLERPIATAPKAKSAA
jgi:predicted transposase YdaD